LVTFVGEGDLLPADAHEALGFHALDHLRDRRSGDPEAFDETGLDDLHVVLAQLEDALAIFFERRVMFAGRGHALKDTY
jgi:DNA transposition AAA+ family ATPase